jgi:hypothetical protein
LARSQAEALIQGRSLCVRLYRRADGTVITSHCPAGVARSRKRALLTAAMGGTVLVASGLVASTFTVMGKIPAPRGRRGRALETPKRRGNVIA